MPKKGMVWNPYQTSIANCILGHSSSRNEYDYSAVKKELPDVPDGTIGRVAKALREAGWKIGPPLGQAGDDIEPPEEERMSKGENPDAGKKKPEPPKKPASPPKPASVATIRTGQPAPTVFIIAGQEIKIDEVQLYESYLLYLDLKARAILKTDAFSDFLFDSASSVWRILTARDNTTEEGEDNDGNFTDGAGEDGRTGTEYVAEA